MAILHNMRFIKIALVLSLALNLLVVGAVGSFFGSKRHKDVRVDANTSQQRSGGARVSGPVGMVLTGLDRKDRRAFGRGLREKFENRSTPRHETKVLMDQLKSVLTEETFDRDRFLSILQAGNAGPMVRAQMAQASLADYLAGLTATDRQQIAEKMVFPRKHKRK